MAYTRQHSFVPSTYAVVRLEPLDALAKLRADMVHDYQPVNSEELFAVERMALARFAMLRADRLVIGMHTASLNEAMDESERPMRLFEAAMIDDVDVTIQQNRSFLLAEGMARINAKSSKDWLLVLRMQVQAERLYRRAVEDYNRIRALRGTDLPDDGVIAPDPGEPVLDFVSHVPDRPPRPQPQPEPAPAEPPCPEPAATAATPDSPHPQPAHTPRQPAAPATTAQPEPAPTGSPSREPEPAGTAAPSETPRPPGTHPHRKPAEPQPSVQPEAAPTTPTAVPPEPPHSPRAHTPRQPTSPQPSAQPEPAPTAAPPEPPRPAHRKPAEAQSSATPEPAPTEPPSTEPEPAATAAPRAHPRRKPAAPPSPAPSDP